MASGKLKTVADVEEVLKKFSEWGDKVAYDIRKLEMYMAALPPGLFHDTKDLRLPRFKAATPKGQRP